MPGIFKVLMGEGAQYPCQLKEPRATFFPKRRAIPPLALVPGSPLRCSCCLFKGLPLPLSLSPPISVAAAAVAQSCMGDKAAAGPVSWCLVGAIISLPLSHPSQPSGFPSPSPSSQRGQGAGHQLYNAMCSVCTGHRGCGSSKRRWWWPVVAGEQY